MEKRGVRLSISPYMVAVTVPTVVTCCLWSAKPDLAFLPTQQLPVQLICPGVPFYSRILIGKCLVGFYLFVCLFVCF